MKTKRNLALALSLGLSLLLWVGCGLSKPRESSTALRDTALPGGDRYVVVLSLDGFRADYQSKAHTPNIDQMDRDGLSGSFRPCYPSLTFPNHYSMATGLHPNNHGLVGNQFWDDDTTGTPFNYLIVGTQSGNTYKLYVYDTNGGAPVGQPIKVVQGTGKVRKVRYLNSTSSLYMKYGFYYSFSAYD